MKIPTYVRQESDSPAVSGNVSASGPVDSGAAGMAGIGSALADISGTMFRRSEEIRLENEQALAAKTLYGFKNSGVASLKTAFETVGDQAVETEGQPGITTRYTEQREKDKEAILNGFSGSEKVRNALSKSLDSVVHEELSSVSRHEIQQG